MKNNHLKKPQNWEKIKRVNKQKKYGHDRSGKELDLDGTQSHSSWTSLPKTMAYGNQDPALPFLLLVIFFLLFQCHKVKCSNVFSSILISFVIWLLTQIVNSEALEKTCKQSHSTRISLHFYMVEQTNFVF